VLVFDDLEEERDDEDTDTVLGLEKELDVALEFDDLWTERDDEDTDTALGLET
jgi:hypothetical protein